MSLEEFNEVVERSQASMQEAFNLPGRPPKLLTIEDKLLALFLYYRSYITHEFMGMLMGLDNANICRLFKRLEPLVARKIHDYFNGRESAGNLIGCYRATHPAPRKKRPTGNTIPVKRHVILKK